MNLSLVVYLKSSLYPRSSRFSPVLPSGSFLVFHLTVRCKIHLELIFVKDVRSVSRFIVFECRCLFVSEPYAEKDIFTPFYSLGSFVKFRYQPASHLLAETLLDSMGSLAASPLTASYPASLSS